MRDAFINSLLQEARIDSNIVLITGDLGFGVLETFQKELPNQFINSGINEQTMMGLAAGFASTGKKVFVYSIGNFPTLRCLEQIRNDVCLMNNSVVIVSVGAGYSYGSQGYTHHALEDVAVLRALPNIDIVVPCDPIETTQLTKMLISTTKPAYLRLGKSNEEAIHSTPPVIEFGKAVEIIKGVDGTLIFSGAIGKMVLLAEKKLSELGISVSVTSLAFISPIDSEYLKQAAELGPIVVVEEHSFRGGLGSAILESLNYEGINAKVGIIAANQNQISQIGDQNFLRRENGISVENIIEKFHFLQAN